MIIFDENIEFHWIELIKNTEWDYFSIRENCPGISDKDVIKIARAKKD